MPRAVGLLVSALWACASPVLLTPDTDTRAPTDSASAGEVPRLNCRLPLTDWPGCAPRCPTLTIYRDSRPELEARACEGRTVLQEQDDWGFDHVQFDGDGVLVGVYAARDVAGYCGDSAAARFGRVKQACL